MFKQAYKIINLNHFSKRTSQQIVFQTQQQQFRKLINMQFSKFSTDGNQVFTQNDGSLSKNKKTALKFFLALLVFNGLFAFGYMKKLELDNRHDFKILMKLLNFKKEYEKDKNKFNIQEIKQYFDEFIVENVVLTLDDKITQDMRKITKELAEKYPKECEVQMFASQVCENEKYPLYLKQALTINRKYVDDVLIRQMHLNCERFGKEKPYYYEEFYNSCTKYTADNMHEEAQYCLEKYMSLNPPQYYKAAIQQIKSYKDNKKSSQMLKQIQELFNKENDLDKQEKEQILSFIQQYPLSEIKNPDDKILADQLLKSI